MPLSLLENHAHYKSPLYMKVWDVRDFLVKVIKKETIEQTKASACESKKWVYGFTAPRNRGIRRVL
jgi:hypothetical protein